MPSLEFVEQPCIRIEEEEEDDDDDDEPGDNGCAIMMSTAMTQPQQRQASEHGINGSVATTRNNSGRVVLLLDMDCFYAQCECIRLGLDSSTTPLALMQWNSVLAVTYPARRLYKIKRGDSWEAVRQKSKGACHAIHVPILTTTETMNVSTSNSDVSSDAKVAATVPEEGRQEASSTSATAWKADTTTTPPLSVKEEYESVFCMSPEEQEKARRLELGVRRFADEGKASIERYRTASARIFQTVQEWIEQSDLQDNAILERASIDEFFLDVTKACCSREKTTQVPFAENAAMAVALKETAVVGHSNDKNGTIEPDSWMPLHEAVSDDEMAEPLAAGCYLAWSCRRRIRESLGFTLSAGLCYNKTLAKLSAGYGKPNGQAVTYPAAVTYLLNDTPISKCRNLGGKLGRKVQALLPTSNDGIEVQPSVGSIARYLSLPELRKGLGDAETATWVYNLAHGIDNEPVLPKSTAENSSCLTKSITAFKSLPFSPSGYSLKEAERWIRLLAQDVVTRVERDSARNNRYPRSCTLHYGSASNSDRAGRNGASSSGRSTITKSVRLNFPPGRLSTQDKIQQLVTLAPKTIASKEDAKGSSYRLNRVGFCATDFVFRQGHAIDKYFATMASAVEGASSDCATENLQEEDSTRSHQRNRPSLSGSTTNVNTHTPETRHPLPSSIVSVDNGTADDLEFARKLQATYDREHRSLQVLESRGATKQRPPKTRRIDSFFRKG